MAQCFRIEYSRLMCVSIHRSHVNAAQTDQLYFVLQPAQLLKGDIMVSGYIFFFNHLGLKLRVDM